MPLLADTLWHGSYNTNASRDVAPKRMAVVRLWVELIGTMLLTMLINGAKMGIQNEGGSTFDSAAAQGVAYAVLMAVFAHRGAQLNPAITFGQLLTGRVGLLQGVVLIGVQILGAIIGAAFLDVMSGNASFEDIGLSYGLNSLSEREKFGWEFFGTFLVVLVYFRQVNWHASTVGTFATDAGCWFYGLAYTVAVQMTMTFSGAGLNPARMFGVAVVANEWTNHWVYWVGPLLGGFTGALVHVLLDEFGGPTPVRVLKTCTD